MEKCICSKRRLSALPGTLKAICVEAKEITLSSMLKMLLQYREDSNHRGHHPKHDGEDDFGIHFAAYQCFTGTRWLYARKPNMNNYGREEMCFQGHFLCAD